LPPSISIGSTTAQTKITNNNQFFMIGRRAYFLFFLSPDWDVFLKKCV